MLPPDDALVPQNILHVGKQYDLFVTASSPADDLVRTYERLYVLSLRYSVAKLIPRRRAVA